MNRGREVLVGVTLLAAVAVLALGTLWLQGVRFTASTREIRAGFQEVGQLRPGNEVKIRGVAIGRVGSVEVSEDGTLAVVTFRVDADVALPEDPSVLLSPENAFGDWQAEVVSRAWYPDIAFLDPGEPSILPGYTIPDISRLTLQAERIANNLASITTRIETAFTPETAENIRVAIDNIEQVSQTLAELVGQQAGVVQEVTAEVQHAAREVGDAASAARLAMTRIDSLMAANDMAGLVSDAREVTGNLREITGEVARASDGFAEAFERVDSTLNRIDRISARVEAGEGSLGMLLADSSLVLEAQLVLQELDELLRDFRENPKRYVRLSIF